MPILGIIASSYFTSAAAAYDSIATQTVGSGGTSSVSFTAIPSTYTHLQIRGIVATTRTGYVTDNMAIRLNSDSGSNYYLHNLQGGYTTTPRKDSGSSGGYLSYAYSDCNSTVAPNVFTGVIIDILDYTSVNKNKVIRTLQGFDCNGTTGTSSLGGSINMMSFLWNNTSAINTITIYGDNRTGSSLAEFTTFALYGIKAA